MCASPLAMAAITSAAESASANLSGSFFSAANRRARSTSNPASAPSGPGKVEGGSRPDQDDELLRFLGRAEQGSGAAKDRQQRDARREGNARQEQQVAARKMQFRSRGVGGSGTTNDDASDYSDRRERFRAGARRDSKAQPTMRLAAAAPMADNRNLRRMRNRSTAGRPALQRREPGQVRKEAATATHCKCRGNGSPPICFARHIGLMLRCSSARALMYVHVHSALSPARASPETDLTANLDGRTSSRPLA